MPVLPAFEKVHVQNRRKRPVVFGKVPTMLTWFFVQTGIGGQMNMRLWSKFFLQNKILLGRCQVIARDGFWRLEGGVRKRERVKDLAK